MDKSIPWIGLKMKLDSLVHLPSFELSDRYTCRNYQDGDMDFWTQIECSAGEFETPEKGIPAFHRYYPDTKALENRMLFLLDGGKPFANATAWYDDIHNDPAVGRLHWVSVDAVHQGQGLSYPLVHLALERMKSFGNTAAYLTTQTCSWVAIKVYHRFGFVPLVDDAAMIDGWRIVSNKTGIDFTQYL